VECSNKGICDRKSGLCDCFTGYEGVACQRSMCPDNCNGRGICLPEKYLAVKAGKTYNLPWDSMKEVSSCIDIYIYLYIHTYIHHRYEVIRVRVGLVG
jgi:hypothetical protein